jgi:cysteinyl-tRNA synthetase
MNEIQGCKMSCSAGSVVIVNTFLAAGIEIKLRGEFAAKQWAHLFFFRAFLIGFVNRPAHIQDEMLHETHQKEVRRSQSE